MTDRDDPIEQAKTWLAGRFQHTDIYRGKPKVLAAHAQQLVDELIDPIITATLDKHDVVCEQHGLTPSQHQIGDNTWAGCNG